MQPSARPVRSRPARRSQFPQYCSAAAMCDLALCAQALRALVLCMRVRSAWAGIGPGASRRRATAARAWTMKSPNFPSLRNCRSSSSSPIACDTCAQKGTHCGDLQNGMRCTERAHIAGTCKTECVAHACLMFVTTVSWTYSIPLVYIIVSGTAWTIF